VAANIVVDENLHPVSLDPLLKRTVAVLTVMQELLSQLSDAMNAEQQHFGET